MNDDFTPFYSLTQNVLFLDLCCLPCCYWSLLHQYHKQFHPLLYFCSNQSMAYRVMYFKIKYPQLSPVLAISKEKMNQNKPYQSLVFFS